jgi:hypothetical protein
MGVYALLLLLPLLWAGVRRLAPKADAAAAWGIAAALILFIGLRRQVGGDWNAYLVMFERSLAAPLWQAPISGDAGWQLLAAVAGRLGLGVGAANLVAAGLLVVPLLLFCRRQPNPPLALLLAVPVLLAVVAMNTTRQAAAIGLEMAALIAFFSGRAERGGLFLLLAAAFHWSALVLAPLGILLWSGWQPPRLLQAAGWAALWALAAAAIFVAGIGSGEMAYGAAFRLAPSLLAAVLLFRLGSERLGMGEAEGIAAAYLTGLALFAAALLPFLSLAGDRFGLYTIPLQLLVLTRAAALAGTWRRAAEAALALMAVALFLLWFTLSSYAACVTPYRTYLSDPAALLRGPGPERPRLKCVMTVWPGEAP